MPVLHIETTAGCPRTPVLLLALEEVGAAYRVELRPHGWFDVHHGGPGPALHVDGEVRVGLEPLLEHVRQLPGLRPGADDLARADRWFDRLAALRRTIARIGAARRAGAAPAAEDLASVAGFTAMLEDELGARAWLGGDSPCAADIALSFLGVLAKMGVALGPRATGWLARLHGREAWLRVRAAFPGAAALELPRG